MSESLKFGNPWHGRLSTGTIDLMPGSPVSSITVDGVEHTVKTPSGNLGDTRYIKAPGLPAVSTPDSIAALGGQLLTDAIIFSDDFRYSPLSTKKVLNNRYEWLLWDSTAGAWRKMRLEYTWYNDISTSSPAGANNVRIRLYRGPVFGKINTLVPFTPPTEVFDAVLVQDLTYQFKYYPRLPALSFGYDPSYRVVTMEAAPDGRKIIIKLEAKIRGDGKTPSTIPPDWPVDGSGAPKPVWDNTKERLFEVWEVVFNADGTSASPATLRWPGDVTQPSQRWEVQATQTGAVYEDAGAWYMPCTLRVSYYYRALNEYVFANAGYDKNGSLHLMCFEQTCDINDETISTGAARVRSGTAEISAEVFHFSTFPWMDGDILPLYPDVISFPSVSSTARLADHDLSITDNGATVAFWLAPFGDKANFAWRTNNVSHINVLGVSKCRIAPGVVEQFDWSGTFYSSFNPRSNELVSSLSPIGWV